ncbi:MAG TPA: hypothetical protein VNA20_14220 [Frankiaceae bacterium]|nr:hypothetical protein [Frankiaceae bacterium]
MPFLQRHHRPVQRGLTDLSEPSARWGLNATLYTDASNGELTDPAARRFRPWPREDGFLYSHYQLLALHALEWTLAAMSASRSQDGPPIWHIALPQPMLVHEAARIRALAVVLEVLAPRYRPRIMRTIHDPDQRLYDHINDRDPSAEHQLLALTPELYWRQAEHLLLAAKNFDPLGKWHRVARVGAPGRWKDLRFDALLANEHRVAAEHLLDFYEDLAERGHAPALPPLNEQWWGARHDRLRVEVRERAETLMDFRLTDRRAVVLGLEGETEMEVVARVLDVLGIDPHSDLVRLVNLHSVDGDVRLLARAVATPRLDPAGHRGARLLSPLTGLIIAVDPEKKYATSVQQAQQRDGMIDSVLRSLPKSLRTPAMRADLGQLIHVRTWGTHSFEFAHYTDRQLAAALRRQASVVSPNIAELKAQLADCRARGGNIEKVWKPWAPQLTKPRLAETMWPELERRITTATSRGSRAPVVQIVREAIDLALRTRAVRELAVTAP